VCKRFLRLTDSAATVVLRVTVRTLTLGDVAGQATSAAIHTTQGVNARRALLIVDRTVVHHAVPADWPALIAIDAPSSPTYSALRANVLVT
jgi:hypothetical protein